MFLVSQLEDAGEYHLQVRATERTGSVMLSSLFVVPLKTSKVTALVDYGNECILIRGNLQKFPGTLSAIYGNGRQLCLGGFF